MVRRIARRTDTRDRRKKAREKVAEPKLLVRGCARASPLAQAMDRGMERRRDAERQRESEIWHLTHGDPDVLAARVNAALEADRSGPERLRRGEPTGLELVTGAIHLLDWDARRRVAAEVVDDPRNAGSHWRLVVEAVRRKKRAPKDTAKARESRWQGDRDVELRGRIAGMNRRGLLSVAGITKRLRDAGEKVSRTRVDRIVKSLRENKA